jgi:hypothetical protein
MMASSAIVLYKDQVPHAARLQGLVQFAMVCYVFRMLVAWQKRATEASDAN